MVMKRFDNSDNENPLCRFGPGGEFVTDWPLKKTNLADSASNPLAKVLVTIAEMIGATINPELLNEIEGPYDIENEHLNEMKEKSSGAGQQYNRTDHAASTAGSQSNWLVSGEPMLFANDSRGSQAVKRKPKYRIRAPHRTPKKRVHRQIAGQGTLFETYDKSTSAA